VAKGPELNSPQTTGTKIDLVLTFINVANDHVNIIFSLDTGWVVEHTYFRMINILLNNTIVASNNAVDGKLPVKVM
jgi:hypothetical protein